jgi:hypothetical protein
VEPGKPECVDYEYERRGTRNLFVMVDEVYPQAEYIRLVQDNLNTHTPAALYATFPTARAAPHSPTPRVPLRPQAWWLVEYGRDRHSGAQCPVTTKGATRRPCAGKCWPEIPSAMSKDEVFLGSSRRALPATSLSGFIL